MKCSSCGAEAHGKFCEYCGSELPQEKSTISITNNYYGAENVQEHPEVNDIGICPKCGNSKITFKRERVGTVTQSRSRKNYIGSGRQGQSVSQSAYRTVGVCQNCGYTWQPNEINQGSGRKTWLWVLGWICIFPLPLTILLLRKKDMKPAIKYGIIAVAWLLFFAIGLSGIGKSDTTQNDNPSHAELVQTDQTTDNTIDSTESGNDDATTDTSADNTEGNTVVYAEDEVVNRFISEYNEKSSFQIVDISKGNIRTKYFGYSNGRYIEMINANDAGAEAFCVTINGGQESTDKQAMYELFREMVKILDPSITDDMIDAALAEFDDKDVLIEGYTIGDSITVTYVPTKELSYGKNSCRIDISASNYK